MKIPIIEAIKRIPSNIKSEKALNKPTTTSTSVVSQAVHVKDPYVAGVKKSFSEEKPLARSYGWFGVKGQYHNLRAKYIKPKTNASSSTSNVSQESSSSSVQEYGLKQSDESNSLYELR
jgi:hypothetical protein